MSVDVYVTVCGLFCRYVWCERPVLTDAPVKCCSRCCCLCGAVCVCAVVSVWWDLWGEGVRVKEGMLPPDFLVDVDWGQR